MTANVRCARCSVEVSLWVKHGGEPMCLSCAPEVRDLEQAIETIERYFYDDDSTPIPTLNRLRELAAKRAVPS